MSYTLISASFCKNSASDSSQNEDGKQDDGVLFVVAHAVVVALSGLDVVGEDGQVDVGVGFVRVDNDEGVGVEVGGD